MTPERRAELLARRNELVRLYGSDALGDVGRESVPRELMAIDEELRAGRAAPTPPKRRFDGRRGYGFARAPKAGAKQEAALPFREPRGRARTVVDGRARAAGDN